MTPDEKQRIEDIREYIEADHCMWSPKARIDMDFILSQLDAAQKLAHDRLEVMQDCEQLWGHTHEAKRLVDQAE